MKRKARIQTGIDDRLVAIYARKSRITNKGDSIGVQFKQSADYAINQLSLPEDYEFARYEDKGLSGYYSDRPDFQRLLRDIEMGKIKAVACYKLDRISRKTSDLMRLLEYFERHDVTLLVCSNNINTRISTSKIIIQVLAIIAEFERDILTERIQDNLMELAKDGRWLGGKTPTGFSSQRVTTGSGKNKSAISFLVPVQEEKEIVLEIYGTFWETRSLLQTANIINEKYETKHGAKFTTSTIRLILRNPIYCVADEYSYNYFLEHDGNLFGEPSDFDGQHGLTAYNKTDQMKVEDEDSTFFNPKFSQLLTRKPISEWIVSVGRHEGFISSRKWVETQNMLDEIAEKYNRPHRKTNALLSGLMYCPICGKRLRVLPESNRWTNGKPRFKYACPGVRAKECTFKGVEGVTLDEFVIHSLSSLQEEHSDYYRQLLENRVASMIRTDQSEKEYQETKKAIERLNADIAAQVRNLREADDALKRFIQDDIKELTDELAKREAALRRMEDTQSENQYLIHELNGMKKRLLSFEEFAKGAQPEALFTLVHSIVDRIYITTDGTKQKCQVYIKGCATEDYSDVLGAAGYIEEEPLLPVASYVPPMCDLDYYSIVVYRVANNRSPSPRVCIVHCALGCIIIAAHNSKGTEQLGFRILRGLRTGDNCNIQFVIVFNDLIDSSAARGAITPDGRVVAEVIHRGDDLEVAAGGVICRINNSFAVHIAVLTDATALADLNAAGNQIVFIGTNCARRREYALGIFRHVHAGAQRQVIVSINALVDALNLVSGRIHLINAGDAGLHTDFEIQCSFLCQLVAIIVHALQSRAATNKADKIQLAIVFASTAENGDSVALSLIIQIPGHENFRFAGLDIEL